MSGRGRAGIVAAGVAVVVAAVLAVRGCGDDAVENADTPSAATSPAVASPPRERPTRVRASDAPETSESVPATQPSGEPLLVDGWPAAQVIVRRPDGRVAPGAWVYAHRADADTPDSLDEVVRQHVDKEGRVALVAPAAGRYDVGAFDEGAGFATLLTDVEFPARAPVEVVLPETARLEVRREGDLPPNGFVSIRRAAAARVTAFPGRRESKYIGLQTNETFPSAIEVPRGIALRIDGQSGVVVEPQTITAPGTITVRPDGAEPAEFEFAFTGAAPPAGTPLEYEMEVAAVGGGAKYATSFASWHAADRPIAPVRKGLPCVRGPVEVQWNVVRIAKGTAVVDTTHRSEGSVFRVEIPVPDWGPCVSGLRVTVSGDAGQSAETVTETWVSPVTVGLESRLASGGVAHIAAVGPRQGPVLVADPVAADTGRFLDLRLVPGGTVRIAVDWSLPLGAGWPITVERADGLPILMSGAQGRIHPFLTARARFDGVRLTIGPLAAGDVELVFRLAGREFGRKRVTVLADTTVELVAPPIVPPYPR